jgi:hypothetical protein
MSNPFLLKRSTTLVRVFSVHQDQFLPSSKTLLIKGCLLDMPTLLFNSLKDENTDLFYSEPRQNAKKQESDVKNFLKWMSRRCARTTDNFTIKKPFWNLSPSPKTQYEICSGRPGFERRTQNHEVRF